MNYSEYVVHWVSSNLADLRPLGRLTSQKTDDERSNPSAHVALEQPGGRFVELLVWDSGEAEFGFGMPDASTDEHHELSGIRDLEELLRRFISKARG